MLHYPLTKLETKNLSIYGTYVEDTLELAKLIRLIFCPIYAAELDRTYVEDTLSEAKKKGDPSGPEVSCECSFGSFVETNSKKRETKFLSGELRCIVDTLVDTLGFAKLIRN